MGVTRGNVVIAQSSVQYSVDCNKVQHQLYVGVVLLGEGEDTRQLRGGRNGALGVFEVFALFPVLHTPQLDW